MVRLALWIPSGCGRESGNDPGYGGGEVKKKKQPAKLERCVKKVKKRGGAVKPYAVCKAALKKKNALKKKRKKSKRNPADESAAVYKEFHGRDSKELVTVKTRVHVHKHLAALGDLEALVIETLDGKAVRLEFATRPILCTNEKKNQLFIEGGNQKVTLPGKFGVSPNHELVTLGKCITDEYFTRKDHLGEDGGTAVYAHDFGTTIQNGRHVKVKEAELPDVNYRVRDEQLEFSGGSYIVRAEGIDK
jgi:hypothetical protein